MIFRHSFYCPHLTLPVIPRLTLADQLYAGSHLSILKKTLRKLILNNFDMRVQLQHVASAELFAKLLSNIENDNPHNVPHR